MIWVPFFYSFFFLSLKDLFFFAFLFNFDSSSLFLVSISPLIMFLIFNFFFSYFSFYETFYYYFFFFLIILFVNFCFFCSSSFLFLFFLELSVYPMTFLILNLSKDRDKLSSIVFMVFINLVGSLPFMFFNSQFLIFFSSFNYLFYFNYYFFLDMIVFFCFIMILVCKLPIFMFHFWLTKAHVSASGSCSMLLASLMLKLGSFGLFKYSLLFSFFSLSSLCYLLCYSIMGSFFISLIMIRFFDIKYLIACSSILHMSLLFFLLLYNSSMGVISSMFMMVGHGIISYFFFMLISLLYEFSFNRSFDFNKSMESSSKYFSMFMFFFIFLNLGVPPFLNFLSEVFFCMILFLVSFNSLFFLCLVMLISIIFCMFLTTKILFGKKLNLVYSDTNYSIIFFTFSFIFYLFIVPFLF